MKSLSKEQKVAASDSVIGKNISTGKIAIISDNDYLHYATIQISICFEYKIVSSFYIIYQI